MPQQVTKATKTRPTAMCDPPVTLPRPALDAPQPQAGRLPWPARSANRFNVRILPLAFGLLAGPTGPHALAQEPPTYYVNAANPTPLSPYTSWATAATNIQSAVNAGTTPGRLILVTEGVYQGGVAVTGAVLRSVSGPAVTIIEGGGPCVNLGTNATLSGFTVRNGGGGRVGLQGVEAFTPKLPAWSRTAF